MLPLYRDPHYSFRFADDRIIPRLHLEGIDAGVRVSVFKKVQTHPSPLIQRTARMGLHFPGVSYNAPNEGA